jgi:hypothetical protein
LGDFATMVTFDIAMLAPFRMALRRRALAPGPKSRLASS